MENLLGALKPANFILVTACLIFKKILYLLKQLVKHKKTFVKHKKISS